MKRIAVLAAPLLLTLGPACIFTPLHPERRQTTEWALDLLFNEPSHTEGPAAVQTGSLIANILLTPVVVPTAWLCDSFVVNPFDSHFDANADCYDVVWNRHPNTQEIYEDRSDWDGEYKLTEHEYTRPIRHAAGFLVYLGDMIVRTNIPVAPRGFGRFYDVTEERPAVPWYHDRDGFQPREIGVDRRNVFWDDRIEGN